MTHSSARLSPLLSSPPSSLLSFPSVLPSSLFSHLAFFITSYFLPFSFWFASVLFLTLHRFCLCSLFSFPPFLRASLPLFFSSIYLPFLFTSSFLSLLLIPFSVLFLVFVYLQISFCFIPLFSLCFLHSLFLSLIFFIFNDLHFLMLMSLLFPALRLFLKRNEVKPLLFCPLYSFSDSVEFELICEL